MQQHALDAHLFNKLSNHSKTFNFAFVITISSKIQCICFILFFPCLRVLCVCGLYIYYVALSQFVFKFAPTSSYSLFLASFLSYILPKDTFESEPTFN